MGDILVGGQELLDPRNGLESLLEGLEVGELVHHLRREAVVEDDAVIDSEVCDGQSVTDKPFFLAQEVGKRLELGLCTLNVFSLCLFLKGVITLVT